MRPLFSLICTGFVTSLMGVSATAPAIGHSWYPKECCHNQDCAPVEQVVRVMPTNGGVPQFLVRSKVGTTLISTEFPFSESKDGRMHVCLRYDAFGDLRPVCAFMPPAM